MFITCSLICQTCTKDIVSVQTIKSTIPRRLLHRMALEGGAVRDDAERWFCGPRCRMDHRLHRGSPHIETPSIEGKDKAARFVFWKNPIST